MYIVLSTTTVTHHYQGGGKKIQRIGTVDVRLYWKDGIFLIGFHPCLYTVRMIRNAGYQMFMHIQITLGVTLMMNNIVQQRRWKTACLLHGMAFLFHVSNSYKYEEAV